MHNIGAELFGDGAVRRRALIGRLCSVQSLAPHGLIDKWRNKMTEEFMSEKDKTWAQETARRIEEKMGWVCEKNKNRIPYTTGADGSYDDRSNMNEDEDWGAGLCWWTNGFFGGILWQMYHATGNEKYKAMARHQEELLDPCFDRFQDIGHDVGFMWQPTAVTDYRLTGDKASRSRGLHAASLLAARYNPAGRFIRAWEDSPEQDRRGWAIIDCMMNLSILYWASEETRDPRFRIVAENYADTVKDNFIRPDGSSNHIVEFDPEKGGKVRTWGGQGYANGSAWTRGQGWAIYGFVISFLHTKREIYLDTSMRTADFFLAHMPKSGIIPIDFLQPEEPALEDSCGACIAASGLIKLAECCRRQGKTAETAEKYYKAGLRILKALGESRADWTKDCDAIVQECAADYHSDRHHMTMVYADYFFMEAVFTLAGKGLFIW